MSDSHEPTERRFQGIGASLGVVRGEAFVYQPNEYEPPVREISEEEVPGEIARFEAALVQTREQIAEMQQRISSAIGSRDAGIFDAHMLVVEDRTLIDEVLRTLTAEHKNVEHVFHKVASRYAATLGEINDPYLRERAIDIHDVMRRVLSNLMGLAHASPPETTHPHILFAHDLTPSDTAQLKPEFVIGFATDVGSKTSHAAIMARSLAIPAVVGLHNISKVVQNGDSVLLDGYKGIVILHPSQETLEEYGQIEKRKSLVERELETLRESECRTADGRHIVLAANIELPLEMETVRKSGAEGVGLYRTEYLFMNRVDPPSEDEQLSNYRMVAEEAAPHPVIIRTLDIGGDKFLRALELPAELNPFLGWRAIRFCLQNIPLFKTQLRAILRASAFGKVKLMYPMISGLDELQRANEVLNTCRDELRHEGIPFDETMEIGAMIEVPSAAIVAEFIAREAHFLSIGTNDLIQYTIAVDRVNERVAHLYEPTHPAVIELIRLTVNAAHAHKRWVGVCGEMAGEVLLTPLLIGLGIDELSTGASIVPRVKRAVQRLTTGVCLNLVEEVRRLHSARDIAERCRQLGLQLYPELLD